jgi:hypothetical protein
MSVSKRFESNCLTIGNAWAGYIRHRVILMASDRKTSNSPAVNFTVQSEGP